LSVQQKLLLIVVSYLIVIIFNSVAVIYEYIRFIFLHFGSVVTLSKFKDLFYKISIIL